MNDITKTIKTSYKFLHFIQTHTQTRLDKEVSEPQKYLNTIERIEDYYTSNKEIQSSINRFASDFQPLGKGIDSIRFRYSKGEAKKAYAIAKKHKATKCNKGEFAKNGIYLKIDKRGIEAYNLKQFNQSKQREYRNLTKSQSEMIKELIEKLRVIEIDLAFDIETKNKTQTLAKRVSKAQYIKAPKGHKRILFSKDYTITKHHTTRYLKPRYAKNGNCIKQVCIYDKASKNNLAFKCVRVEYTIKINQSIEHKSITTKPRYERVRDKKKDLIKSYESEIIIIREANAPP